MIAASKMKRAQTQALKGRPYLTKLKEILADIIFLSDPRWSILYWKKSGG